MGQRSPPRHDSFACCSGRRSILRSSHRSGRVGWKRCSLPRSSRRIDHTTLQPVTSTCIDPSPAWHFRAPEMELAYPFCGSGRVADVGQVPVCCGNGVRCLLHADGSSGGSSTRVPHVVLPPDANHFRGIPARNRLLVFQPLQRCVFEVAVEFVAAILVRVPAIPHSRPGGTQFAIDRLFPRHDRRKRFGRTGTSAGRRKSGRSARPTTNNWDARVHDRVGVELFPPAAANHKTVFPANILYPLFYSLWNCRTCVLSCALSAANSGLLLRFVHSCGSSCWSYNSSDPSS